MSKRIEGKVAQILNPQELVINRGSSHGVVLGMTFAILNSRGKEIRDPDTNQVIGSVELEKAVLKVVRLQDLLCVARTFRTTRTAGGVLWGSSFSQLSKEPKTVRETLKIDQSRMKEELDEQDSFIKIGDPAVQIVKDEFDASSPSTGLNAG